MSAPVRTPAPPLREARFTILTINDVYEIDPSNGVGGLAQLKTMIDTHRKEIDPENMILTVPGDFLSASAAAEAHKGAHMIDIFNRLGVDVVVPGNHEFDEGGPELRRRIAESDFAWVCANVLERDRYEPEERFWEPLRMDAREGGFEAPRRDTYASDGEGEAARAVEASLERVDLDGGDDGTNNATPVKKNGAKTGEVRRRRAPFGGCYALAYRDFGPVRVGFFGVCTQETPNLSFPGDEVEFGDVIESARECVEKLRSDELHCDCVVALTHVNIPLDREIVKSVGGIDLVLGGHDHHPYAEMVDRTLIFKTGHDAHWLGRVDLHVRVTRDKGPKCHISYRLDANVGYDPDPQMEAVLDRYRVVHPNGDEVLCDLRVPVETTTSRVRTQETTFPCVVADALRTVLAADIGVINGGFVRGDTEYTAGHKFTREDLARELPFPSPTTVIVIKGKYIREALEQVLRIHPDLTGAFPHVSGLLVDWCPTGVPLSRIRSVTYEDGTPLDESRDHHVALTRFMAEGGDGITAWGNGDPIESPMPGARVAAVVEAFFKMYPVLTEVPNFERRLRVVPE